MPQLALAPGGGRETERLVRVGPDEGQASEHDPHLAGPYVIPDELGERQLRPLGAIRALGIGELDERDRRRRPSERRTGLRNAPQKLEPSLTDNCSACADRPPRAPMTLAAIRATATIPAILPTVRYVRLLTVRPRASPTTSSAGCAIGRRLRCAPERRAPS